MNIEKIKEIVEIQKIIVRQGEKSEIIKRGADEFLIVIAVQGYGILSPVGNEDGGYFINDNTAPKLDFRNGNEFQITVRAGAKEPLIAIVFKMKRTKNT